MDIQEFISGMENVAPPGLAEEFDTGRIGLIVEGKKDITRVFCALDASAVVIRDAVRQQADMLVVHHTPIFHPVTAVKGTPGIATPVSSCFGNEYFCDAY